MECRAARIDGAFVLVPSLFTDERGYFKETYVRSKYEALGLVEPFVQDNLSFSRRNVVRGLHADPQMSKLVQVTLGKAFDVIVDARAGSPTFGQWEAFELTAENHRQLYIPRGCLHGFQALSDEVVFSYKQTAEYDPQREIGVLWCDDELRIEWPVVEGAIVSERDRRNERFSKVFRQSV